MKRLFLLLFVPFFFSACCTERDCFSGQLGMVFIGYAKAETDSLFFRKYEANGLFNRLKDSALTTFRDTLSYLTYIYRGQDSTFVLPNYVSRSSLSAGFDYTVTVLATKRTYRISNIREFPASRLRCTEFSDGGGGTQACYNPIISYTVDGTQFDYLPNLVLKK